MGPESLVESSDAVCFVARDGAWALGSVSSCYLAEEQDEGAGLSLQT